jgi:hypothetical protein
MVYPRKPLNKEDGKSVDSGRQDAEAIHLEARAILEQKRKMLKAGIGATVTAAAGAAAFAASFAAYRIV